MWQCVILWTCLRLGRAINSPPTDWDIRANIRPQTQSHHLNRPDSIERQAYAIQPAILLQASSGSKDCLDGVRQCEQQSGICRVDLEIFKQFCGDWLNERSLLGCNKQVVKECRSALRTVNDGRLGLRHCTCDSKPSRSIDDLSKCNLLRRNLNSHPCLQEPPLLFREESDSWQDIPLLEQQRFQNPKPLLNTLPRQTQRLPDSIERSKPSVNLPSEETSDSSTLLYAEKVKNVTSNQQMLPKTVPNNQKPILVNHRMNLTQTEGNAGFSNSVNTSELSVNQTKSSAPSCLQLLEKCTIHLPCAKSLNRFRALCSPRSCEKLRSHCNQAYKEFQSHGATRDCTCDFELDPKRKQRCQDYELRVLQNKCVDLQSLDTTEHNPVDMQQERLLTTDQHSQMPESLGLSMLSTKSLPELSHLTATNATTGISDAQTLNQSDVVDNAPKLSVFTGYTVNCYDIYRTCVSNPKCLLHYFRLARLCALRNGCHMPTACRETLRGFYASVASGLTNQALACSCPPNDLECNQQRIIFKPECAVTQATELQSCSSLWERCRDEESCNTALSFLINQCHLRSKVCQENSTTCLDAYRQVWLRNLVTRCRCDASSSLVFYHTWQTVRESFSYHCDAFQSLLLHPPCQDHQHSPETTNARDNAEPVSPACRIANTLHLSPETIVRVYPKTEDMNHSPESQVCSQLCGCTTGCLHHLCFPEHHREQLQQQEKRKQLNENSGRLSSDRIILTEHERTTTTRITLFSVCHHLPLADPQCACLSNGDVYCNRKINYGRLLKNFQLHITYARDEFSTILGLLDRTVSSNEFQYYVRLLDMAVLLETVLINTTGNNNCALVLARHRIPQQVLDVSPQRPLDTNDQAALPVEAGQLTYFIVVNPLKRPFEFNEQTTQRGADEICLQSLQLLELMINQRFPQIRYHPLLSVLKQASLVNRPISTITAVHNTSRYPLNQMDLLSTPVIDQQSAWRKPRTSHKKRLEPINASRSRGIRRNSDRIWSQSIVVLGLVYRFTIGWSV